MAALYRLALLARDFESRVEDFKLLLTLQRKPSPSDACELWDTDLYDLPFAPLSPLKDSKRNRSPDEHYAEVVRAVEISLDNIGLKKLNVHETVKKIVSLTSPAVLIRPWRFWRLVEEPDFGPGTPIHTIMFMTDVHLAEDKLTGSALWMDSCTAMDLLIDSSSQVRRVGQLAAHAFTPHFPEGLSSKLALRVEGQAYPPGFCVVPMKSCTIKPFTKTNLVIFAPTCALGDESDIALATASGSALIADPGCENSGTELLSQIVESLPGRLLVFLTHHHHDHVHGLATVSDTAAEVVLLAHHATFRRMGTAVNKFKCITVSGGNKLNVAGQELEVISAPGHTDGHLALFHRSTGCLVAGDHCVGHGSSLLDASAGGNMKDYLDTTRRFLSLHPKVIVPMHGRPNFWPIHLLNEYIKHRESREAKVLKAIESGAETGFEIVSRVYSDTDPSLWPAALSNVKLHVEHLAYLRKIPVGFSVKKFLQSCGGNFLVRCVPLATGHAICRPIVQLCKESTSSIGGSVSVMVVIGACALFLSRKAHLINF